MVGAITGSKKNGMNPDNATTPMAAGLDKPITLSILSWVSQGL